MRLQSEADDSEGELEKRSINLSGGGIGVTVNALYQPNEILSLTLLFPDEIVFKASIEVLRVDPILYPADTYRLHARFVRLPSSDRELLIRQILQFQREHLNRHYSV